jgi:hypothetical protein
MGIAPLALVAREASAVYSAGAITRWALHLVAFLYVSCGPYLGIALVPLVGNMA